MPYGQQLYDASGQPVSDDQLRSYYEALANEDRNRYDTDNTYRYDSLHSQDKDRKAQRQQAKDRLAEERRQYDQTYGQKAHQFDVSTGVDLLKTGAQMRGALNWIQGDSYAQGSGQYSQYLTSLRNGGNVNYGGATATQGNPTPLTVSTLANAMSGGDTSGSSVTGGNGTSGTSSGGYTASGTGSGGSSSGKTDQYGRAALSSDAQAYVDAVSNTAQKGLANQGLGWWENQTGDQRDAYTSASDYLGRNTKSEIQYYNRSRPGQRSASLG